jgi:TonB family protein
MTISSELRAAAVLLFTAAVVVRAQAPADQNEFASLLQQGKEAVKQGRLPDAETAFRRAVALEPLSAEALDALADVAYRSGHKDKFSGSSRFDEAKGLLEKAVSADPNSFPVHYDFARIITSQCVPSLMQANLDAGAASGKSGDLPYGPLRRNLRSKIGGLLEEGIGHAQRAMEIDPNSSAAMREMSMLLVIRANIDETPEASETDRRAARDWAQKAGQVAGPQGNAGIVRIGSRVAEANLIGRVDPAYPASARAIRLQGTVEFTVTIDEQGHVADMKLVMGHPLLVNAAKEAVAQWIYKPTLLNGQPVKVMTTVDVPFRLEE